MARPLRIAFFGSSLVSAYWNGAATYYRGIISALARLGHQVTFYEPNAFDRQAHRDIDDPPWARVVVYQTTDRSHVDRCLDEASHADVIVKASGVGVFDEYLEGAVLRPRNGGNAVVLFWDVDAPATLDRVRRDSADPFGPLIARYDAIMTYGGGPPVVEAYLALGARRCVPIYNALDPSSHHPVAPVERYAVDLAFLGNRLPDRETRVDRFLLRPARALPSRRFLLGGSGWGDKILPPNVRWIDHVYTADHNAFNCSPLAVLNVSRDSMARYGFSPATRIFEAAGAGACIITDAWAGIQRFLEPNREILVARDGEAVASILRDLRPERARTIGRAARSRVLAEHTYNHRAKEVEATLTELVVARQEAVG